MEVIDLFDKVKFDPKRPHADPLHVDQNGRAILFTLEPGQIIREHNAPHSPFFAVILKGEGVFSGGDGVEQTVGPSKLLVFDPGEDHAIRALDELIFVGFLHGAPGAQV